MFECPTIDDLCKVLDCKGASADPVLDKHLEECQSCQNRLEQLVADPDWKRLMPIDKTLPRETIINANDETVSFKDSPTDGKDESPEITGYTLEKELGRGGMGVVYLAHQHALNRKVALKLLTQSTSPERWVRFRVEAEAIGRLQHPNIVQVFDSGEYNGCPFVVQELANDGTLAERLENTPLAPRQAARWLRELAGAMEHAHQQGVLHRDIKPSNILFAGETVKLADFGLAKLVDRTDLTRTLDVIGTPSYMAPEQATGKSQKIGPATDVFNLGILLYELLTGVAPFRAETALETIRLVNDHEPVAPRQLQPKVPRDLNTICLKCLNKQPASRYATASELERDLTCFLDGKPIHAKPPGPINRCWKWSRRRPALASMIVASVVSAAALLIMWAQFTNRVSGLNTDLAAANESLKIEKVEVERQRNAAHAVRTFLVGDLLRQANAQNQLQRLKELGIDEEKFERDPRVSTLVRLAARSLEGDGLERRFPDDPDAQMETLGIIGDVLYNLGEHDEAVKIFERALKLQPEGEELSEKQWKLWNYVALQYSNQGRYDEAIERFKWLLQIHRKSGNQKSESTVEHNLAGTYFVSDKLDLALVHATHAIEVASESYGSNDPQTLAFKATLGSILRHIKRYEEALKVLENVLAGFEDTYGELHPRTISTRFKLGKCLSSLERSSEALEQQRQTAEQAKQVLGPNHPKTMYYRRELARCLSDVEQYSEAITELEPVLEFHIAKFGRDHKETKWTQKLMDDIIELKKVALK